MLTHIQDLGRATCMALAVVALFLVVTGCGTTSSPSPDASPSTSTGAASTRCVDVVALTRSLDQLKTLNVHQEGLEALKTALARVQTQVDAATTTAADDLQQAVQEVGTALAAVQAVVRGVSEDTVRQNLSAIAAALVRVRTAGGALTTKVSRSCPVT